MKWSAKLRQLQIAVFGYRAKWFWNIWALYFDKDPEQTAIHGWNSYAIHQIIRRNPESVVEVGCGFGRNLSALISAGFPANRLTGIDISQLMIKKCKKRLRDTGVKLMTGNILNIPLETGSVEFVYSALVTMHVSPRDVSVALAELFRVSSCFVMILEEHREMPETKQYIQLNEYTYAHNYSHLLKPHNFVVEEAQIFEKWVIYLLKKKADTHA